MASDYFMGTDDGGYDGSTFTICVMKMQKDRNVTVEYLKSTRDRDYFIREIDRLKNWHKIPEKQWLWQKISFYPLTDSKYRSRIWERKVGCRIWQTLLRY